MYYYSDYDEYMFGGNDKNDPRKSRAFDEEFDKILQTFQKSDEDDKQVHSIVSKYLRQPAVDLKKLPKDEQIRVSKQMTEAFKNFTLEELKIAGEKLIKLPEFQKAIPDIISRQNITPEYVSKLPKGLVRKIYEILYRTPNKKGYANIRAFIKYFEDNRSSFRRVASSLSNPNKQKARSRTPSVRVSQQSRPPSETQQESIDEQKARSRTPSVRVSRQSLPPSEAPPLPPDEQTVRSMSQTVPVRTTSKAPSVYRVPTIPQSLRRASSKTSTQPRVQAKSSRESAPPQQRQTVYEKRQEKLEAIVKHDISKATINDIKFIYPKLLKKYPGAALLGIVGFFDEQKNKKRKIKQEITEEDIFAEISPDIKRLVAETLSYPAYRNYARKYTVLKKFVDEDLKPPPKARKSCSKKEDLSSSIRAQIVDIVKKNMKTESSSSNVPVGLVLYNNYNFKGYDVKFEKIDPKQLLEIFKLTGTDESVIEQAKNLHPLVGRSTSLDPRDVSFTYNIGKLFLRLGDDYTNIVQETEYFGDLYQFCMKLIHVFFIDTGLDKYRKKSDPPDAGFQGYSCTLYNIRHFFRDVLDYMIEYLEKRPIITVEVEGEEKSVSNIYIRLANVFISIVEREGKTVSGLDQIGVLSKKINETKDRREKLLASVSSFAKFSDDVKHRLELLNQRVSSADKLKEGYKSIKGKLDNLHAKILEDIRDYENNIEGFKTLVSSDTTWTAGKKPRELTSLPSGKSDSHRSKSKQAKIEKRTTRKQLSQHSRKADPERRRAGEWSKHPTLV